jgi:hypothetical protein
MQQIQFQPTGRGAFFTIPDYVFERRLAPIAFCVYLYMKCMHDNGKPWDGVKATAAGVHISTNTVRRSLLDLIDVGLVIKIPALTPEGAHAVLAAKTPQSDVGLSARCEWCSCRTAWTHAHHYPVMRADGGTETVNICPNCHTEFHALTRVQYRIAEAVA